MALHFWLIILPREMEYISRSYWVDASKITLGMTSMIPYETCHAGFAQRRTCGSSGHTGVCTVGIKRLTSVRVSRPCFRIIFIPTFLLSIVSFKEWSLLSSGQVLTELEVSLPWSPLYSYKSQGKTSHFSEADLQGKLQFSISHQGLKYAFRVSFFLKLLQPKDASERQAYSLRTECLILFI